MRYSRFLLLFLLAFTSISSAQDQTPISNTCAESPIINPIFTLDSIDKEAHPSWTGSSFLLEGEGTTVTIEHDDQLNFGLGDLSLHIRFLADPASPGTQVIFDKRYEYSQVQGVSLFLYRRVLGIQLADGVYHNRSYGDSWTNYLTNINLQDGEWHDVWVTLARNQQAGGNIYVDGNLIFTFDTTRHPGSWDTDMPLTIGQRSSSDSGYFYGEVEQLDFYPCSLTIDQIDQIGNLQLVEKIFKSHTQQLILGGATGLGLLVVLVLGLRWKMRRQGRKVKRKREQL